MDIFNLVRGENDNAIFASTNTTTTNSSTNPTSTTSSTGFNTNGNTLHMSIVPPFVNQAGVPSTGRVYHNPGNTYSDVYGPTGLGGGVSKPSGPLLVFPIAGGAIPEIPLAPGSMAFDSPGSAPGAQQNRFHPAALFFGSGMSKTQHALTQSGQLTYIDMRPGKTPTMTNIHYPKGVTIPRLKPGQSLIGLGLGVNVGGATMLKSDPRYQQYLNQFKPQSLPSKVIDWPPS